MRIFISSPIEDNATLCMVIMNKVKPSDVEIVDEVFIEDDVSVVGEDQAYQQILNLCKESNRQLAIASIKRIAKRQLILQRTTLIT